MNKHVHKTAKGPTFDKADRDSPAFFVTGRETISVKAGTVFDGVDFLVDTPVAMPADGLEPGTDYAIALIDDRLGLSATKLIDLPTPICLGGFHFAPGGNAAARAGGDDVPAINPFSIWDLHYRPVCADPRGMTLVEGVAGKFWCDIYLTGVSHDAVGTSRFGATIADGNDGPIDPASGKPFKKFDYETAVAVLKHHAKQLLSISEFFDAGFGVTEKSCRDEDPGTTGLDAPRTSKWGLMQATGNMWVWGHDGDPDTPRASIFGGYWWGGDSGSRRADFDYWPDDSFDDFGARGRSDHLQLG